MAGAQQIRRQPNQGMAGLIQNPMLQFGLQALAQTGGEGIVPTTFGQQLGQAGLATMQQLGEQQRQKVVRDYMKAQAEQMKATAETEEAARKEKEEQRKRLQALAEKKEITPKDILLAGYPKEYVKLVTEEMKRGNEPPKYIGGGMVWDPNTNQAAPIQGYAEQRARVAGAEAEARAQFRAPPVGRQPRRRDILARRISEGTATKAEEREFELIRGGRRAEGGYQYAGAVENVDPITGQGLGTYTLSLTHPTKPPKVVRGASPEVIQQYQGNGAPPPDQGNGAPPPVTPVPTPTVESTTPTVTPPGTERQVTGEEATALQNLVISLPLKERSKGNRILQNLRSGMITRREAADQLRELGI